MAMAAIVAVVGSGVTFAPATPLSSETVAASDDIGLYVKNASGSPINVTLTDASVTYAGSAASNPVIAVAAGTEKLIYVNQLMASPTTSLITVTFSSTTSITAAWFRM